MKLYFGPGACSLASHIALRELGAPFDLAKVDLRAKTTADGVDFTTINPKGYVPALQLNDGSLLTEGPAILQYLADQKPAAGLAPANGTMERYRLQEWLGFINSEMHKAFGALFMPGTSDQVKQMTLERLGKRFDYAQDVLSKQDYLLKSGFSVADAYLYTVLTWTAFVGIDLGKWPALQAFKSRIAARPAVQAAHAAEAA